jgi:S1-C subfamily serine protease
MWFRTLAAHAATALVTLALVLVLFGSPTRARREPPPLAANVPEPSLPTATVEPREPSKPAAAGPAFESPPVATPELPPKLLEEADAEEQVNIRVYAAANRSVVNITTATESVGFFGEESSSGTGSGFVIDHEGHILTNYHVVEGAQSLQVKLYDGSTHDARVIGEDASNDVAVVQIRVPAEKLAPLKLGDSARLLVGQKILALGNPFGLERTLTTGIISSLDRSLRAKNGRMIKAIIQTDAAINPGNSGGPLLNSRGEVIGMNTAILSEVGQSAGISFAVPINAIARILKPLIEHGRVIRADLGVIRGLATSQGLLVLGLTEDGPASRAGIQAIQIKIVPYRGRLYQRADPDSADVIVAINGTRIKNLEELMTEVEAHAPGTVVKVTVFRAGKLVNVPVKLGQS